jgi:D-arabinose 1-dehydrogenase-like Zn-dependent alcohol dehydrogenase
MLIRFGQNVKMSEGCNGTLLFVRSIFQLTAFSMSSGSRVSQFRSGSTATKLAGFKDLSRFAIIGVLEKSSTLPKFFRIVDADGKTVCYAAPTGPAETLDFTTFIQKRVGLVGTIEQNTQIGGVLVRFNEIAEIE